MHKNISKLHYLKKYLADSLLFRKPYSLCVRVYNRLHLLRVLAKMKPYSGVYNPCVDSSTLNEKVMCGYQGWFSAKGDGSGRDWSHYGQDQYFSPSCCKIDLWPDVSDMSYDEKYSTQFKHKDGKTAYVFSSYNSNTVLRHFQWMQKHGIDGIFLQRFLNNANRSYVAYNHNNVVTANVQAGANRYGRTWAIMYDLTGLEAGDIEKFVIKDWKQLIDRMKVTQDKSYLHHQGKPVVAVWGIGFNDGRKYTLAECEKLVNFLKTDKKYGGNTVMLSVPTGWRNLNRDSVKDKMLHQIISQADIVSPWTVGRYNSPQMAKEEIESIGSADIEWTKQRQLTYLPVVFPGFSWQNLQKTPHQDAKLNQIPRLKGAFLWSQSVAFKQAGARMLFVAMFDELNEGTAIFKCTNNPPIGNSRFLTYAGLPSDHYLWLVGRLGELLRNKIPESMTIPIRNKP